MPLGLTAASSFAFGFVLCIAASKRNSGTQMYQLPFIHEYVLVCMEETQRKGFNILLPISMYTTQKILTQKLSPSTPSNNVVLITLSNNC